MNHERFDLNLPPKVAFLALKEWSTEQVFREELVVFTSKIICFLSLQSIISIDEGAHALCSHAREFTGMCSATLISHQGSAHPNNTSWSLVEWVASK